MENKKTMLSIDDKYYLSNVELFGEIDENQNLVNGEKRETRTYKHNIFGSDKYPLVITTKVSNGKEFEEKVVNFVAFNYEGTIKEQPEKDNCITLLNGKLELFGKQIKSIYMGEFQGFKLINGKTILERKDYTETFNVLNGEIQPEAFIVFKDSCSFEGVYEIKDGRVIFKKGKYISKDLEIDGEWQDNKIKNGYESRKNEKGDIYKTFYKNHIPYHCIDTYKDGSVVDCGLNKEGKRANGSLTLASGMVIYCDDCASFTSKNGRMAMENELIAFEYVGEIVDAKSNGHGTIKAHIKPSKINEEDCNFTVTGRFEKGITIDAVVEWVDNRTKEVDKFIIKSEKINDKPSFKIFDENGTLLETSELPLELLNGSNGSVNCLDYIAKILSGNGEK